MIPLILPLLFVAMVAISALVGLIRGFNKSFIRIVTLVVAAALTFVVSEPITAYIAENIAVEGKTLGEMLLEYVNSTEIIADIIEAAPLMQEAILVAPAFVIAIVVFPIAFLLLKFVTWLVFLCVQKPLRKLIFREKFPKKGEKAPKASFGARTGKRFGGLVVGAVTGALIFGMVMTPLFGLISVLPEQSAIDKVLDTLVEQGTITKADAELIKGEYAVTDSELIKIYTLIGVTPAGKTYLNSVSKIEADGQQTYLADEFDSLLAVVQTAIEGGLLDAINNPENQDALYAVLSDKDFVTALMQDMFNSKLLRSAVPEVMAIAMETVAKSLNVPADKEVVYENMMNDIATAVKDADVDYDFIKAYEEEQGISYIDAMDSRESLTAEHKREKYDNEIKKRDALETKISSILSKNVLGGNETLVKSLADNIVKDVQNQVFENGENVVINMDVEDVKNIISSISSSDIEAGEGSAEQFLEKLTDSEKFETPVATLETIKEDTRESLKAAVTDDTKSQETANTLASVISDFASAVSGATDENGNIDATKLNFDKVGGAVTSLQNSPIKGLGSTVLDIVVSGDLGKNEMVGDALGAVKEGYENNEDVGGVIGSAGALVGIVGSMNNSNNGSEPDKETMVTSITSLINNLNDFTFKLLPKLLTSDMLEGMGVPAEYTEATYSVFETLLKELMKLKGSDNYDNEVEAIISLYNLATSGIEKFTKEDIKKLVEYADKSDAIFNTLNSVSESNPFGITIESAETRTELVKAIEDAFAETEETDRERDIFNAVAKILGLDADVNLG